MIRQAITRWMNAKAECLEAKAAKMRCAHDWGEIARSSIRSSDGGKWEEMVVSCKKCGDIHRLRTHELIP